MACCVQEGQCKRALRPYVETYAYVEEQLKDFCSGKAKASSEESSYEAAQEYSKEADGEATHVANTIYINKNTVLREPSAQDVESTDTAENESEFHALMDSIKQTLFRVRAATYSRTSGELQRTPLAYSLAKLDERLWITQLIRSKSRIRSASGMMARTR
jgi:hypothetical protein